MTQPRRIPARKTGQAYEGAVAKRAAAKGERPETAGGAGKDHEFGIKAWMYTATTGLRYRADRLGDTLAADLNRMPITMLATFCLTSVFAVAMMLSAGADYALAQDGSQIQGAITSVRNWLAGLIVGLGGIALLVAIIIFLFSGSESRRRAEAARYIGAICVAIAAGLMVPAIIGLIQGFASGGGT